MARRTASLYLSDRGDVPRSLHNFQDSPERNGTIGTLGTFFANLNEDEKAARRLGGPA